MIVPRHPQRFDEVAALLRDRGLAFVRRSDGESACRRGTRVVLGDTMGEMLAYYAAADVAFVGGSLLPLGGQNLIEAIALGVPMLVGPHTFNFAEATERAIEAGAALRVRDADALVREVAALLRDPPRRARDARGSARASSPRIAARPSALAPWTGAEQASSAVERRRTVRKPSARRSAAVDVLEVLLGERADRGLEAQQRDQVVEVRLREVAPRVEQRSAARSARRGWCARRPPGRGGSTRAPTSRRAHAPARTPSPTPPRC